MWEFLKANPFVVGALTGSLAAYLLGLVVSHLRREKRWLGYSVSSRNIVQRGHSKLAMKYGGRDIVRLDSHTIHLRNIGNRPLVRLPVCLECLDGGQIVEHESMVPHGATYTASLEAQGRLVVTVDLLNPGEAFTVGLTVADAERGQVNVVARGELLEVKDIGERASTEELLQVLMPHVPFVGTLWLALFNLLRSRRRR